MSQVNEYKIDPITGEYVGDVPGTDYNQAPVPDEEDVVTDIPCMDEPAYEPEEMAILSTQVAPTTQIIYVGVRDIVTAMDTEFELTLDISLAVDVRDTSTQALVNSGVVTKRVRISKTSLSQELTNRSATTPITEAVTKTVSTKQSDAEVASVQLDEEKRKANVKRIRELAGIPASGNWV